MQVAEVAAYECKMRVVHNVTFRILVLVEAQQPAAVFQAGQYLARMSSSTKRYVYIRASGRMFIASTLGISNTGM